HSLILLLFFLTHPAPTHIYTLSLHDALPISRNQLDSLVYNIEKMLKDAGDKVPQSDRAEVENALADAKSPCTSPRRACGSLKLEDRKSTRLNSSHSQISYAVFCLKKKINIET